MKLASFLYQGKRSYGIVQADGVIDLGRRLGDRYNDLKALLEHMIDKGLSSPRRQQGIYFAEDLHEIASIIGS